MLEVVRYACSNWLIAPLALAMNESPPGTVQQQKFTLILSGVAVIDFESDPQSWPWAKDTLHINPDLRAPLEHAVVRHRIPTPPGNEDAQFTSHFQIEQSASVASLASVENPAERALGFACDAWRNHPYETRTDAFTSGVLTNLFAGIDVDLAAWAGSGRIHRVNYHITLVGKIVFAAVIIT